jgi:prolipoprotein diacylglyceryltransferase
MIFFIRSYGAIGNEDGESCCILRITLPVMMQSASFVFSWDTIVELLRYGFVFYGGVIGAILGFFLYAKQYKLQFFPLLENAVPSIPLIHSIGRIGCFLAGCCYGKPMDPPWGVYFNPESVCGLAVLRCFRYSCWNPESIRFVFSVVCILEKTETGRPDSRFYLLFTPWNVFFSGISSIR